LSFQLLESIVKLKGIPDADASYQKITINQLLAMEKQDDV